MSCVCMSASAAAEAVIAERSGAELTHAQTQLRDEQIIFGARQSCSNEFSK